MHRPGAELRRVTPRDAGRLMFASVPWAARAQQEHDQFTQALRDRGVQVLYLTELLQDVLEYAPARQQAIGAALDSVTLGEELRGQVWRHLAGLGPEVLCEVLISGLMAGEFTGRGAVYQLLSPGDFIVAPLPNLMFTRDGSTWIGDRVAVASPPSPGRRREAQLAGVVYRYHPLFTGTKVLYDTAMEPLDAADVLLAAPGVIAIGCCGQDAPPGVERLARQVFDAGLAHTVLAVALDCDSTAGGRLDTTCTMLGADTVLMRPATAYTLTARAITPRADGLRVSHPQSFIGAMSEAIGVGRLRVIETGLYPVAGRDQWDEAGNLLAVKPGVVLSQERNAATNARLEDCGIEVIRIPASELTGGRGGPRAWCCPIARDPSPEFAAACRA